MPNRSDNFNRANGSIGTPSDAGSAWIVPDSGWSINGNRAHCSGGGLQSVCFLESGMADADIEVTVPIFQSVGTVDIGIVARVTDDSNYILAAITGGDVGFRLFNRSGGFTQIGSTVAGTWAAGDVFRLRVNGTSVELFQNGVLRISGASSAHQTVTKHGLRASQDTGTYFDSFSISAITGGGGGPTPRPGARVVRPSMFELARYGR